MTNVLIVLTSHTKLGDTGRDTGFYFDEMATPYWALVDAGFDVDIASISGGAAQHDPGSVKSSPEERPLPVARFLSDQAAMEKLTNTLSIETVDASKYHAVFLPGGHGTMYDFPFSVALARVVSDVYGSGGVVGAVCHGPAGLVAAIRPDGEPLVAGLQVNSFTDAEEEAVNLTGEIPFLLETRLRELGAKFESVDNFKSHAVRDGRLVTGQNPASVAALSVLLVNAIAEQRAIAAE